MIKLVHVEVSLEYAFLHSIRNPGLRHLADRRLHDSNTLSTVVCRSGGTQHRRGAGDGAPLGSGPEVLSEIVTFAIWVPNASVALPNIPHCTSSEAQASSKGCCWVTAVGRCGKSIIVLKGTFINRARVGTRDALGTGPRGLKER